MLHTWSCTIHGLWCLASFTLQNVFKVHLCCDMCSINVFSFIVYIQYHILSIHQLDRLFPYFSYYNIVMSSPVQLLCGCMLSFLLDIYLREEFWEHMVTVWESFLKDSQCFCQSSCTTNGWTKTSDLFTSLQIFIINCLFQSQLS